MVLLQAGHKERGVVGVEIVEGLVGGAGEEVFHSIVLLRHAGPT